MEKSAVQGVQRMHNTYKGNVLGQFEEKRVKKSEKKGWKSTQKILRYMRRVRTRGLGQGQKREKG